MGSPVIFSQPRLGRNGEVFTLHKFRTMLVATGQSRDGVEELNRLTPFGRRLRRTSLDELPQLLNIIRGNMSFVGPRPLLPEYRSRFTPDQAVRQMTRPGLTGLAQISGRNGLSWEDRLSLDAQYARSPSFRGDLHILLKTLAVVFRGDGVEPVGGSLMPPYRPSPRYGQTGK
jgi:lipopolysaccharide/colanic/teichoic acid biosynthesis glycosyltransferase